MRTNSLFSSLLTLALLLLITNCNEREWSNLVEESTIASVSTSSALEVTYTSVILGGEVTDDGGSTVSERGICYSTTQNPTIINNKVIMGSGLGDFSITVSDLNENTNYYVRAYAINSNDIAYGAQISFKTPILLPPTALTK